MTEINLASFIGYSSFHKLRAGFKMGSKIGEKTGKRITNTLLSPIHSEIAWVRMQIDDCFFNVFCVSKFSMVDLKALNKLLCSHSHLLI